jgi:endonuclease/exonuclease/phosphatase family metal-dependent hydrolase
MTWNIGYGALGSNADFFMDGGKMVYSSTSERVQQNLAEMADTIREEDPDILFLQEVDRNSDRSYHVDQSAFFAEELPN